MRLHTKHLIFYVNIGCGKKDESWQHCVRKCCASGKKTHKNIIERTQRTNVSYPDIGNRHVIDDDWICPNERLYIVI